MNACILHDTLRNDADDGDECVECGATFPDPARRHVYIATQAARPAHTVGNLASSPTSSDTAPHRQPGWYHVVQMNGHGVGVDKRRGAR